MLPGLRSALFLTGLLAVLAAPSQAQELEAYAIRPGDKVTVEVFTAAGERVSVIQGERILDRNGDIYLPYVGTVRAAGLDHTRLRELLVREYNRFYSDPVVDVRVELLVNVTGAVRAPGRLFLDPTARLFDAIAAAGGATIEHAVTGNQIPSDQRIVQLVREGERQVLNFHPADVTDATMRLRIRSGDWIHVPAQRRTSIRDDAIFWGSLVSFAASVVSLIFVISG